ncbi:hypothetical protein [Microcoleus sp.]|uniref:hypothetical protein n=1 Tax=Microcoleus sp. TaxID=44472 RepID=UPI00403E6A4E
MQNSLSRKQQSLPEITLHKIRQQAVIGIKLLEDANIDIRCFNAVNFFRNKNF